jgi:hypothetical protein
MLNEIVLHGAEKRPITPSPHGVEKQTPNIKKKTPASGSLKLGGEIGLPIKPPFALPVNVRSAAGQSQLQHPIICNNKIRKAVADRHHLIIHLLTQ